MIEPMIFGKIPNLTLDLLYSLKFYSINYEVLSKLSNKVNKVFLYMHGRQNLEIKSSSSFKTFFQKDHDYKITHTYYLC